MTRSLQTPRKILASAISSAFTVALLSAGSAAAQNAPAQGTPEFHGKIAVDIRDSKADWAPYMAKTAKAGSPNVLFILYDDVGLAGLDAYGGAIHMPALDRLAANGLTYTQWHTAALSSPTRATLLTGRNHHAVGTASISEGALGFPGANGRIPASAATIGQILQANGYSTYWLGKDHNVPEADVAEGATRRNWPLQMGFDRFYGFLGAETNQYYPDLVEDNRFIEPPYGPEQGYHLSKDLADHAIGMIADQKATNPSRPWFMWLNPGASHAPHQVPKEWIDKYKGKFDGGYEAYREWVLQRMIVKGVLPAGTKLTPINPLSQDIDNPADRVRPWSTLSPEEKKLFERMAETWAGFLEYTDTQMERVLDYLQQTGQLDNTIVVWSADNGTSGEGTPNGSVNENKLLNGYPDDIAENISMIDKLGTADSYGHMPTGWAVAFSTPFKMFKRYSQFAGGTCTPLVISWPKGIAAHGEIRNQYHHSVDFMPTILDVLGIDMPKEFNGVEQMPLAGVSMKSTFDAKPDDSTNKHRQYYTMLGTRGIWQDGWKAAALHAPLAGHGHFDQDVWELYHVDVDRSESTDLSKQYPEKLAELKQAYEEEAATNHVYPLDDRGALAILLSERPVEEKPKLRYEYYPDRTRVPEASAPVIAGRSYKIVASVDLKDKNANGVVFAHGTRFGGHALFIKDHKLHYVYNFLGIKPEQDYVSKVALTPGKHTLGMEFQREKAGQYHESLGTMKLYVDGKVVAQGTMRTQAGRFTLAGDGLTVGYDYGDTVTKQYKDHGHFTGGSIHSVVFSLEKNDYAEVESKVRHVLND